MEGSELDLGAVRAFAVIAEERFFGEAAARLGISQQAVSKRIAKLESELGLTLFYRTRGGADLTRDGAAFLPHARALVGLADQAVELARRRHRALRVDVLDTRVASIELVRSFHRACGEADIDVVTSNGLRSARDNLGLGHVDAVFARAAGALPEGLEVVPAYLEPLHLLVGRTHPLAGRRRMETAELAGMTVWMPGNEEGSEWAAFYAEMAEVFGFTVDTSGPDFGWEHFVETVAEGERVSFAGERTRLPWHPDTTRIPLVGPSPAYPCSLIVHRQNRRGVLRAFVRHVREGYRAFSPARHWLPAEDREVFGL
ncbi:LysR family transcriptional regulator [Nonomuraea sp. NPDC050790]|uniref:LysR family transcriptional regulator n=1 Tax=Nonomuraea sp. NPDC050790 TaxID=3364371 RepID=UPI003794FACD